MQTKLLESIRNCKTLPVIPVLSIQILSMCQNERADAKKMAQLIGQDPAFAAKLLSLSNSGFYARIPHKLTSLTQAVTVLGRPGLELFALPPFARSGKRRLRSATLLETVNSGQRRRTITGQMEIPHRRGIGFFRCVAPGYRDVSPQSHTQ